jgi:hypothetical protein
MCSTSMLSYETAYFHGRLAQVRQIVPKSPHETEMRSVGCNHVLYHTQSLKELAAMVSHMSTSLHSLVGRPRYLICKLNVILADYITSKLSLYRTLIPPVSFGYSHELKDHVVILLSSSHAQFSPFEETLCLLPLVTLSPINGP